MADSTALFGGYWAAAPSPVIDDLADACALLQVNGEVAPPTTVVVQSTQTGTGAAANGRAVVSYPVPQIVPSWGATDGAAVCPVLARGLDFDLDPTGALLLYDTDPLLRATQRTQWAAGAPGGAATLWIGQPPAAAAPGAPQPATYAALVAAVAAATGAPYALGPETVQAVYQSATGTQVITDRTVYRLPPAAAPVVAVGQVLEFGQPIGTAWALTYLSTLTNLPFVTTPASFHQGATAGGVTWYNQTTPLVVDTVGGVTRARFSLGAASLADFNAFWAASQANGVANGFTLADALDTRTNPTTQPTPQTLPAYVNPFQLLCRELLAGNAWLLVTQPAAFGPAATDPQYGVGAVPQAAGPYTAVFAYQGAVPALTPYTPS